MTPVNSNANPFLAESEPLLDKNPVLTKGAKICLGVTATIYTLGISAIIATGVLKTKQDCSGLNDDALLSCKNIQENLETAQACLITALVVPIFCCLVITCTHQGKC